MTLESDIEPDGSAVDDESSKKALAKREAAEVSGAVKEQGAAIVGTAHDGEQKVAAEMKQQAGELNRQFQTQLREVWDRSQSELSERAADQTGKAASNLRGLSEELRALADGRPDEAARVAGYVSQAADQAARYANRLDQDGFSGVASDFSRFARRRPGLFLLGAVAAGFASGRLARGAQAAKAAEPGPTTTQREPASELPLVPVAVGDPGEPDAASAARPRDPLAEVLPPGYLSSAPSASGEM